MSTRTSPARLPFTEFIILMALMMSLVALSIDAILPALPHIASDLSVTRDNDRQLVVSLLLLGLGFGQLLYGPLSDSIGRKRAIFLGYLLFTAGSLCCIFATSFTWVLIGRVVQGFGIAAARIVTVALIRDLYVGRQMARIMSYIMSVFLFVPAVAPAMGQGVLLLSHWRWVFAVILCIALATLAWFVIRHPETLDPNKRRPFSLRSVITGTREVFSHKITLTYTLANGFVFGAFLGVLNLVQQIFQEQYELGTLFPLYFAGLSLSIGVASWLNGRLVVRLGMRYLTHCGLYGIVIVSILFIGITWFADGHPSFWQLMLYMMSILFATGLISGNLNAVAMEPLGELAGIGAAATGALSTLMSVALGSVIGFSYANSVMPWPVSFAVLCALALVATHWPTETDSQRPTPVH